MALAFAVAMACGFLLLFVHEGGTGYVNKSKSLMTETAGCCGAHYKVDITGVAERTKARRRELNEMSDYGVVEVEEG